MSTLRVLGSTLTVENGTVEVVAPTPFDRRIGLRVADGSERAVVILTPVQAEVLAASLTAYAKQARASRK
jgi:hypothetical protein